MITSLLKTLNMMNFTNPKMCASKTKKLDIESETIEYDLTYEPLFGYSFYSF